MLTQFLFSWLIHFLNSKSNVVLLPTSAKIRYHQLCSCPQWSNCWRTWESKSSCMNTKLWWFSKPSSVITSSSHHVLSRLFGFYFWREMRHRKLFHIRDYVTMVPSSTILSAVQSMKTIDTTMLAEWFRTLLLMDLKKFEKLNLELWRS